MDRKHTVKSSAHDAAADKRHLLVGERKDCRPNGVSAEMFKITLNRNPALRRRLLDIIVRIWRGEEGGRGVARVEICPYNTMKSFCSYGQCSHLYLLTC